jgi:hypothetical protein
MRNVVGIFGAACGAIVIGLVGRYGYRTTDIEADAWIVAFLYAAIAAGGLFGHAVAVRLWAHNKLSSIAMGLVSAAALLLNLSNSLGAIAGRADTATMERVSKNRAIRAAETERDRLESEKRKLGDYKVTDQAAVDAAKRASDTATSRRRAECGDNNEKRGSRCRDREEEETVAADALARATAARALTDRASKLDADAQIERERLAKLGAIVTVNVQGSALAKLFRLPDAEADFAATAQQFGIAIVVELIIVMCLVAWETLRQESAPKSSPPVTLEISLPPDSERKPVISPPPRPRLVAQEKTQAGAVAEILAKCMHPAPGTRVELEECQSAYADACAASKPPLRTLPTKQFVASLERFCRACQIETKVISGKVYLMDVQLVASLRGQETQ